MNRGYLTYNGSYELMTRLGNFIAFNKAFIENPVLFDCDNNIILHLLIKKVKISKTIIDKNKYNYLLDCSNISL